MGFSPKVLFCCVVFCSVLFCFVCYSHSSPVLWETRDLSPTLISFRNLIVTLYTILLHSQGHCHGCIPSHVGKWFQGLCCAVEVPYTRSPREGTSPSRLSQLHEIHLYTHCLHFFSSHSVEFATATPKTTLLLFCGPLSTLPLFNHLTRSVTSVGHSRSPLPLWHTSFPGLLGFLPRASAFLLSPWLLTLSGSSPSS